MMENLLLCMYADTHNEIPAFLFSNIFHIGIWDKNLFLTILIRVELKFACSYLNILRKYEAIANTLPWVAR